MEEAFPGVSTVQSCDNVAANRCWLLECKDISLLVISILSLVVPIRPLLRRLRWSWLCWSIAPILLTLTLRIIRILRPWTALGRTVALLLSWVALLPRVLLLLGWVSLLWRWSLVSVLLLAVLRVSYRRNGEEESRALRSLPN